MTTLREVLTALVSALEDLNADKLVARGWGALHEHAARVEELRAKAEELWLHGTKQPEDAAYLPDHMRDGSGRDRLIEELLDLCESR